MIKEATLNPFLKSFMLFHGHQTFSVRCLITAAIAKLPKVSGRNKSNCCVFRMAMPVNGLKINHCGFTIALINCFLLSCMYRSPL